MSIAKAISNAMTGLAATSRGTETVAGNLANVMTPGYARREMVTSVQLSGGVRIDGVARIVNASLLSESRLASASMGDASVRAAFQKQMEGVIGLPGDSAALSTALTSFQTALGSAVARPDDEPRLAQVLNSATTLAAKLNTASQAVQAARSAAQQAIATDVGVLNTSLERVAFLNTRIAVLVASGQDAAPLLDERQQAIDRISSIVPVQEVTREAGKVALFTSEGAVLLDGSLPATVGFQGGDLVTAGQTVGAPLQMLTLNGDALSPGQMRLFAGGSLAGNFQIRDELAPQLQAELDAMAYDLHQRLADPAADATLGAGDPGLFTDQGGRAQAGAIVGLSGRLAVNAAVNPAEGGALWRIRGGLGSGATPDPVGRTETLNGLLAALDAARPSHPGSGFDGNASIASRFGTVEARVVTRRVGAESDLASRSSRHSTINSSLMAGGVDSDAEMQRLLQYEQAFAANARVLNAINEMMNQILRI
ncbi:flagellar hook-associated protein FlgK [Paracoccus sp. (in: a-proteobacteria)]|uniref:flagellar hook-associated protein FlgK n=1 Tax=Paracoccus sp. TaxID=267 RepID=UPI00396C5782